MSPYTWRRGSLTTEHSAVITLARRTAWPDRCPRCDSPDPARHPAVQYEGEVSICPDPWHEPTSDLLLVVDSTEDRRRVHEYRDGLEEVGSVDFEEVAVGDPHLTPRELAEIEDVLRDGTPDGWDLERLWGEP